MRYQSVHNISVQAEAWENISSYWVADIGLIFENILLQHIDCLSNGGFPFMCSPQIEKKPKDDFSIGDLIITDSPD